MERWENHLNWLEVEERSMPAPAPAQDNRDIKRDR